MLQNMGTNLTYSLARIVTNRHLYGSAHGPSVKDVAVTNSTQDVIFGTSITRSWSEPKSSTIAFIYTGAWCTKSLSEEGGFRKLRVLMTFIDRLLVCPHLLSPSGYADGQAPVIPELVWDGDSLDEVREMPGRIRSCKVCSTDYRLDTKLRERSSSFCRIRRSWGETWAVEISRWHKLGGCRSPHDVEWYSLVTRNLDQDAIDGKTFV